jgi:hypothetical protein
MKQNLDFQTQIAALAGNKQAGAALRLNIIFTAALTAVKGTDKYWLAGAAEAAKSKSIQGKALHAGFVAVGYIALFIKPQEQITAEERAARNEAEAERLANVFETAYLAALPAEKTEAEKEQAKAKKAEEQAAAVKVAVEKEIAERGLVAADSIMTDSDVLRAALALLVTGRAAPGLMDDFRNALGVPAALAQSFAEGKAAALAEFADKQAGAAIAAAGAAAGAPAPAPAPAPAEQGKPAGKGKARRAAAPAAA